jgi:hypothetical protein
MESPLPRRRHTGHEPRASKNDARECRGGCSRGGAATPRSRSSRFSVPKLPAPNVQVRRPSELRFMERGR